MCNLTGTGACPQGHVSSGLGSHRAPGSKQPFLAARAVTSWLCSGHRVCRTLLRATCVLLLCVRPCSGGSLDRGHPGATAPGQVYPAGRGQDRDSKPGGHLGDRGVAGRKERPRGHSVPHRAARRSPGAGPPQAQAPGQDGSHPRCRDMAGASPTQPNPRSGRNCSQLAP